MTFLAQSNLTAATIKLTMDGNVVGALQSLRIDDNYNTIRVGQIGTPLDIAHVPGRVQVNLSARRMTINYELISTFLRPIVSGTKQTGQLTASQVKNLLLQNPYGNIDGVNTQAQHFYTNFHFDIEAYDDNGKLLYKIKKCSIVSKSTTIDQGAVIISEDITMFGMYVDYGSTGSALDGLTV